MPQISEHDEFLLSRLLDNDLSPAEAETLRRRIEDEPDLGRAFATMTRLDGLLKQRRADVPRVNWKTFHVDVTRKVARIGPHKARSQIIRLSRWLAVGLPLAAAASIALVVILHKPTIKPTPSTGNGGPPASGNLSVVVRRPESPAPAAQGKIEVNFTHSQRLAEAIWLEDAIQDEKPWWLAGGPAALPEVGPLNTDYDIAADLPPM
ncbi:MAG: hypothetical protein ACUVXJ_15015 [Phycisphaerae bacterium]